MAINTLEFIALAMTALDQQLVAESTTGWMEQNAGQVIYNGGNEVKIPTLAMDGLSDYDRDNGFNTGGVSLKYQTKTLGQDRGRTFQLDRMDVNETNFVANASSVMSEFQRQHVIPEVDAYRYSKIYSLANAANSVNTGNTLTAKTALAALKKDIRDIEDIAGDVPLVCSIPRPILALIEDSEDVKKQIDMADFTQGTLHTKVRRLDNTILIPVPSARMKTAYTFYKGLADSSTGSGEAKVVTDRKAGGFVAAADAKQINWIITPSNVPIAISKTDTLRVFDPNTNQKADAWKIDYRKYHELWIKDNQLPNIMVNTQ